MNRLHHVKSARAARRGVMLLIVTLVLAALTLSGAALVTLMKTERQATNTRGRASLVKSVDRSAVTFLIAAVESSKAERAQFGGLYDNPKYFCAVPILTTDEGGEDTSRFTVLSPKFEDARITGVRYGLVDESTRLNLEAILEWDRETPGTGREVLMKLPGMTANAADSILDWIDPDENARPNGAEARYYSEKKLPYSPRNAVPVFLEELLLARGVTRSQLYCSDESFTYGAEDAESEEERALGGSLSLGSFETDRPRNDDATPWKELLTVFSAEKDVDPQGEARVDLNGTDLQFLYRELASRVGDDLAKFVVLYRQYGPRVSNESSGQSANASNRRQNRSARTRTSGYVAGANARTNAQTNAQADSSLTRGSLQNATLDYDVQPTATLQTPLDLVGASVAVGNVEYASPISAEVTSANSDKIFQLLDYCSTSPSTTIVGRVNINAAPREVIAAIPGLSAADAQKIISNRPDLDKELPSDYRHAAWLYTKKLVDLPTMRKLYNKTCAQGDVYRGQVVGFLDGADDTARAEVVVDGSTIPPRQVFYKDLTTLGKGFNAAVLLGGLTADDAQNGLDGTGADGSADVASFDLIDIENARASGYNVNANRAADPFAAIDSVVDRANAELGLDPSAGQDMTANAFGTAPDPTAANNGALGGDDSFATGDAATAPGGETAGSEPTRRERMLESLQQARRQRQTRYESLANANRQEAQEPQAAQETAEPAQEPEYSVPTPRTNQTNRTNRTQPEEQDSGGGAATGGRASDGNADSDGPAARRARLLETLRAAREQRQSRYSSETEAGESEP